MERTDRLWIEGRFLCCDCQDEIDDSRLVKTPLGEEICEICAVKCFICENQFRYNDMIVVNGDNICPECRKHFFVIYDSLHNVYCSGWWDWEVMCWSAEKHTKIILFDSMIETQEYIVTYLSGNPRYQIQKL